MRSGVQRQRPAGEPQWPQGQGRVALLQFVPVRLKALKPKETDFEPRSMGEHFRKRRLELRLTQKQVAEQLGVNVWTVLNWEKGHTKPPIETMPALLKFLGYDPSPEPKTLPERLLAKRRAWGWSIREAAQRVGVDPGTWRDWEQGRVILYRRHRILVAWLLELPVGDVDRDMRARWIRSHK